ncbi:MAG: LytTR family DNA-binding domain-containing protein [Bacteroidetes bacterium]|nr:LytTR family DNA-binding domain-containing protein [Bacteroidota bacterium]
MESEFMIRTVIVADGSILLDRISNVLTECCPHVELAGSATGIKSGVALVNEQEPDLVILDTRLSDGSGFELVRQFEKPDFKIVFISSRIDHAVNAIKLGAIDYLIKPLQAEELTLAINKAVDIIRFEESLHKKALDQSINKMEKTEHMVLRSGDQVHMISIADIIRIEAYSNYSTFYIKDGRQIVMTKSLKEYEEALLEHGFHRIHKSHIFNIKHMSYFDKVDGGTLILSDGSKIPVASRKREMLQELFNKYK